MLSVRRRPARVVVRYAILAGGLPLDEPLPRSAQPAGPVALEEADHGQREPLDDDPRPAPLDDCAHQAVALLCAVTDRLARMRLTV